MEIINPVAPPGAVIVADVPVHLAAAAARNDLVVVGTGSEATLDTLRPDFGLASTRANYDQDFYPEYGFTWEVRVGGGVGGHQGLETIRRPAFEPWSGTLPWRTLMIGGGGPLCASRIPRKNLSTWILLWVLAVLGVVLMLRITRWGIGLWEDTSAYSGGATSPTRSAIVMERGCA